MVSSRTVSVLLGRSEASIGPYLLFGGVLFVSFAVASIAYHLLLESLIRGWPLVNTASVVRVGTVEVPYYTVSRGIHLLVLGAGFVASLVAARRDRGLLAGLSLAVVAIVGFGTGETLYYHNPVFGPHLGPLPVDVGWIAFIVLHGFVAGVLGFLVGRGFE